MKNKRSFELRPENSEIIFRTLRFKTEEETPERLHEGIDRAIALCADPDSKVEFGHSRNSSDKEVSVHIAGIQHAIGYLMKMPGLIGEDSGKLEMTTNEFDKISKTLAEISNGPFRGVVESDTRLTETIAYYGRLLIFANSEVGKVIYKNVVEQMPQRYWYHDLELSQCLKMQTIIRNSCTDFVSRININPESVDVRAMAIEQLNLFRKMLNDHEFESKTNLIGPCMQMTTIEVPWDVERFPRRYFRWLDHGVVVDRRGGEKEFMRLLESEEHFALGLEPVVSRYPITRQNNVEHNSDFGFAYFPLIQISKNINFEGVNNETLCS